VGPLYLFPGLRESIRCAAVARAFFFGRPGLPGARLRWRWDSSCVTNPVVPSGRPVRVDSRGDSTTAVSSAAVKKTRWRPSPSAFQRRQQLSGGSRGRKAEVSAIACLPPSALGELPWLALEAGTN